VNTSKVFDNEDFGYRRLTIERPLRLRFQITLERKERFLDACPDLLDDLQAIDKATIGREASPRLECHLEASPGPVLKERDSKWRAPQAKAFRDAFTEVDPKAEAVIVKKVRWQAH
jgi:type I restriction enzyme M protein